MIDIKTKITSTRRRNSCCNNDEKKPVLLFHGVRVCNRHNFTDHIDLQTRYHRDGIREERALLIRKREIRPPHR